MASAYEEWAISRLREKCPCRVEPSMRCIPLREDMICMSCFESDKDSSGEAALGPEH
jgi:hypothetical protein